MSQNLMTAMTTGMMSANQATINSAVQKTKLSQNAAEIAKTENAAREFESVFVSEMMKPMFEDIKTDGMFGGGKGEEVFRNMLLDEYGKMVAKTDGFGLADQVKQQMIMMQEQANGGTQN